MNHGKLPSNPNTDINYIKSDLKTIWLAGGCFWGVEAYMARVPGVAFTEVGYANGRTENPTYQDVCHKNTGHAETTKVEYAPDKISLGNLLGYLFNIIDPTSLNKQGEDKGTQYRTGIYYTDPEDLPLIMDAFNSEQKKYDKPIVTEVLPLSNYYQAEEYHQKYLEKNPNGYCHVDFSSLTNTKINVDATKYVKPDAETLKSKLTDNEYKVTQLSHTEPPFQNQFWNSHEKGIYVDIVTGEPLFTSSDKFDSGCGWPSFTKPIEYDVVNYKHDSMHGMERTEVRSRAGDSHLGHVFNDGPEEEGGQRYCINSAALRFIPLSEMEKEGYGEFMKLVET